MDGNSIGGRFLTAQVQTTSEREEPVSNFEHDRPVTTHRRSRLWGWLTGLAVVILVAVGVFFSTDRWGENATRTGGGADTAQAPAAASSGQPGVPNMQSR